MAKHEEDPRPTPTQAELDAIKRGETGVTDEADADVEKDADEKEVTSGKTGAYKTRQVKAD